VDESSSAPTSACACLIFIAGERIGRKLDLDRAELLIGRDPRCDLTINSDLVSRNHARMVTGRDTTELVDLGSTNGSYVNDEKITQRVLVDGDRIAIGKWVMKYLGPGSAEAGFHEEVYRLVSHDGLTDLYNKRFFDEHLGAETANNHGIVSILVFDADHFKKINDTYGHPAGDAVLRQLSSCAKSCVQEGQFLARVGGEEFSVLAPGLSSTDTLSLGEAIRLSVEKHTFQFGDLTIPVTISVGVATLLPNEEATGSELYKRADAALYRAKEGGRNRVCS
jgi:diguanylate cyclase (GGDEF)-like protein